VEVHLVADTNLFFECKALDQLPWQNLGFDPVVILLTKPTLDEIDKHKKATGRTRSRALEIFGQVRSMLSTSTEELEIRASAPRVLLRRSTHIKPDDALKEVLDYSKTDERLVGIVSTLNASASGHLVKLFTDDTGPAVTADGLNVPYLMIDESWRRPASQVRVEFEAKGPLLLKRSRPKDDEDAAQSPTSAPRSSLPSPPKPPAFERRFTRFDPPVVTSALTRIDLATLNFDPLRDKYKSLTAMTALDARTLGLFPDHHISRMADLMDAACRKPLAGLFDQAGIAPMFRASPVATPSGIEALIPSFNRPTRHHDPEAFYFDQWSADTPVKKGALTCR
jgi:PIN domain